MEQMAKIIQNSLSLLDKKVEGLLDQITTKSGALTMPVGHDGNQIRKGRFFYNQYFGNIYLGRVAKREESHSE